MKILSLETASEICSVAILEDNKVIKELHLENGNTHSQNLMPLIEQILNDTNLSLKDIDLYSCNKGPGSFTGIRIGISTIKAFRDVTLKPIIGISSLEALTYNVKSDTDFIFSIIDAKNDNVYYGIFKNDDEKTKIGEFNFSNINNLLQYLKTEKFLNKKIFFVGNGSIVYKNMIEFELNNNAQFFQDSSCNKLNAINVGIASFNTFNKNKSDFSNITPLYLKKSSAELTLEGKNESTN